MVSHHLKMNSFHNDSFGTLKCFHTSLLLKDHPGGHFSCLYGSLKPDKMPQLYTNTCNIIHNEDTLEIVIYWH